MKTLTMGSLFDGIGGFPLAAVHNGIIPVWASEIEAFPIEVTRLRFPDMIHVGDITKLNGAELPPVDIICGGSPRQNLSVAGARAGLAGERSGLFMDQIRIVKEMRDADELREHCFMLFPPMQVAAGFYAYLPACKKILFDTLKERRSLSFFMRADIFALWPYRRGCAVPVC